MAAPSEKSKVNVGFDVKFKGEDNKTPSLTYSQDKKLFSLQQGPLEIGTLEDFGSSVASFFGGHFPDTDDIPVIGAIMNKLSFRIKHLEYLEAQKAIAKSGDQKAVPASPSAFELAIDIVPVAEGDESSLSIGKAQVTDIDIMVDKNKNLLPDTSS